MWQITLLTMTTLITSMVAFVVAELLGFERVATWAAWAAAGPTAVFALLLAAVVVGYLLATIITAWSYLFAWLRR